MAFSGGEARTAAHSGWPREGGRPMDIETTAAELPRPPEVIAPLRHGERLGRAEFERRYEAMPDVKAELLNGVVYMASPVSDEHGQPHAYMTTWLGFYALFTSGVTISTEGTVLLGEDSEPQPDVHLRILES